MSEDSEVRNLTGMIEYQDGSVVSQALIKKDTGNVTLLAFDKGEELSEHTASRPALLHFLQGEAQVTLGQDQFMAQTGTWVHMPAHLPHTIFAVTPTVMLLLMI